MNGFSVNTLINALIVHVFFVCFPISYLETVMIDQKNERPDKPFALGDITRWIGIYFLWRQWREIAEMSFGNQFHF